MGGILPAEVLKRRKQGFAIPLRQWFRGNLNGYVRELLLAGKSKSRGIFNTTYIEALLDRHQRGRELDLQLWTLISFELWCRTFLDRPQQIRRKEYRDQCVLKTSYEAPIARVSSISYGL